VFSEPSPHLPGDVPARVVPDQKKGLSCPVPRVPRSTTRGIASLWNSRADHRRTSATCRRVGLHQHSSKKPMAHRGSASAVSISRSRRLFFVRTGDPVR
jgi:hypothetical protein